MGTSNINHLTVSVPEPDIRARHCKTSPSQTLNVLDNVEIKNDPNFASNGVKIRVVSSASDNDDPNTPKSSENRIPITVICPPAPRKPKRVLMNGKRKATCFPEVRVLADFMVYVETMLGLNQTIYVPDIVVGDLGTGDHRAKRLKPVPPPAHEP